MNGVAASHGAGAPGNRDEVAQDSVGVSGDWAVYGAQLPSHHGRAETGDQVATKRPCPAGSHLGAAGSEGGPPKKRKRLVRSRLPSEECGPRAPSHPRHAAPALTEGGLLGSPGRLDYSALIRRASDRRTYISYPTGRDRMVSISWSRAGGEEEAFRVAQQLLEKLRQGASQLDAMEFKDELLAEHRRPTAAARGVPKPRKLPRGSSEADARAKDILAACESAPGRRVTDADVLAVLRLWSFRQNTARINVLPKGELSVRSEMVGVLHTRMYAKCGVAAATRDFPAFTRLLCRYVRDNPPEGLEESERFPFTTICVNKGYAAARHRDNNNVGISIVRALGDFQGGRLLYWARDPGPRVCPDVRSLDPESAVTMDVGSKFCFVDGRKAHEVEPFIGERYSLVYFTITKRHLLQGIRPEEVRSEFDIPFPGPGVSEDCGERVLSGVTAS